MVGVLAVHWQVKGAGGQVAQFRTADLPAGDRFAAWHDMTSKAHVSIAISTDRARDFAATISLLDLGSVQVSTLTYPPLRASRLAALIIATRQTSASVNTVLSRQAATRLSRTAVSPARRPRTVVSATARSTPSSRYASTAAASPGSTPYAIRRSCRTWSGTSP